MRSSKRANRPSLHPTSSLNSPLNKLKRWIFLFAILSFADVTTFAAATATFDGNTPLAWSALMARSEMIRRGTSLDFGANPDAHWDYASGLFADALQRLGSETSDGTFAVFGNKIVDSFVTPQGEIRTYRKDEFNLDSIEPGKAVLADYLLTHGVRLRRAAADLRDQLAKQPRTQAGVFWHKQRYRQQVWLDGLYMAQPFYAEYSRIFGDQDSLADVARQIIATDSILYNRQTGLYFHGWDQSRDQPWADKATGLSSSYWSRAIGWYSMAVTDVLDSLREGTPGEKSVREIANRVAAGITRWQDSGSGVWWQVTDQGSRRGNYLEASASSMFVYALAKGVNRGYLNRSAYYDEIVRGYAGLVRQFVRRNPDGSASLLNCCSVAGLGGTPGANGRPRDGSFSYYVGEPVVENDLKAIAPFILAGIETQEMLSHTYKIQGSSSPRPP